MQYCNSLLSKTEIWLVERLLFWGEIKLLSPLTKTARKKGVNSMVRYMSFFSQLIALFSRNTFETMFYLLITPNGFL